MKAYHETQKRFRILQVHRRFGKTVGLLNHLQRTATLSVNRLISDRGLCLLPNQIEEWQNTPRLVAYIAPYYNQAKSIAWSLLKYYAQKIPGARTNESELRIDYPGLGQIRLFGADHPETFRGLKFWEVGLDEFQHHSPDYWQDDLRPACFDTQAPITFAGTTIGEDHFYQLYDAHKDDAKWFCLRLKASESGILDENFLKSERESYEKDGKLAKYLQEYELDLTAAIEGAIWGEEIRWLRDNNHIAPLKEDEALPVHTYWDLGIGDYTVIWFTREYWDRVEIIDCWAGQNIGLDEISKIVRRKPYTYAIHHLPHDSNQREKTTARPVKDSLMEWLPGRIESMEAPKDKEDDIDAFKAVYKKIWINSELKIPISALTHYARPYDEKRGVFRGPPVHDWTSHYADALMLLARALYLKIHAGVVDNLISGYNSIGHPKQNFDYKQGEILR